MGGVCGVAVESEAVRISYFRDGQRVEDSIDAEGARWLLNGKLVDCGPFDDVVLTGRDTDVVESLLASLSNRDNSTIRMVDEGAALLAYARSVDELADARELLVLDLGKNGTSAFTLDVLAGEVKRSARRSVLSGDALDDIVERLVLSKDILPPAQSPEAEAEYRLFFRELKELITESAGVRSPGGGPMLLTRAEFDEEITATLLQTLAWAAPNEPDAVLLIGGGAKIPLVKTLVEQEWTVPLVIPESPGSVILEGAALEAAPSRPHFDIGDVMDEQALDVGTFEELDDRVDDFEPQTTPMRVLATRSAPPLLRPTAPLPASPETSEPARDGTPTSAPAERRRIRWSVRDAAGLVGVVALVAVVWAVVFVRGDTPPPPGIGVEPVGTVVGDASVAEGAPEQTAPVPDVLAPQILPEGAAGPIDEQELFPGEQASDDPLANLPLEGPGLGRDAIASVSSSESGNVDTESPDPGQ